jgi:nucleoside-diphosphate-sugar epimerase
MPAATVLITGATGLVGRGVVAAFAAEGWSVLRHGRRPDLALDLVLDLALPGIDLTRTVAAAPDLVVHLAAVVPGGGVADDETSAAATRRMDAAVAAAHRDWGSRLLYMSSASLYDRRDPAWKTADSPVEGTSPYRAAKLAGEQLLSETCGATVFRLSSPIGPGMRPDLVFMRFLAAARAGQALQIWGSGLREQDFIAVEDVARLMVAAAHMFRSGIYNACVGQPTTMRELAVTVVAELGRGCLELTGKPDPGDGDTARYDISATRATFGWEPALALRDMVHRLAAGVS